MATDLIFASVIASVIFYISTSNSVIGLRITNQVRALLMLYTALTILCVHSLGVYRQRKWDTGEALAIAKSVGLASL
ncbi:MAG TPA: hypothetical protein VM912_07335, partial [Terriglobales bacterium]|nr:hypothetical protein [Terriglobales bacterium]